LDWRQLRQEREEFYEVSKTEEGEKAWCVEHYISWGQHLGKTLLRPA